MIMIIIIIRELPHSLCRVGTCGSAHQYKLQAVTSPDSSLYAVHKHSNHRTSYFKSTLTFLGPAKHWKSISATREKRKFLRFFIIICNFKIFISNQSKRDSSVLRVQMLTKFISIGSYSPEVTKVFRLIICKTLWLCPQIDPLPRDLILHT